MRRRKIYITEADKQRLEERLFSLESASGKDGGNLEELGQELERAEIVPSGEIPGDVITMNSTVRLLDLDTGKDLTYTLVFPADASVSENRISVLAPIGTALIGYRVGDVIPWKVPAGQRKLRVEEIIYQPERSGDFDR